MNNVGFTFQQSAMGELMAYINQASLQRELSTVVRVHADIDCSDAKKFQIDEVVRNIFEFLPVHDQLSVFPLICKQFFQISEKGNQECFDVYKKILSYMTGHRRQNSLSTTIAQMILNAHEQQLLSLRFSREELSDSSIKNDFCLCAEYDTNVGVSERVSEIIKEALLQNEFSLLHTLDTTKNERLTLKIECESLSQRQIKMSANNIILIKQLARENYPVEKIEDLKSTLKALHTCAVEILGDETCFKIQEEDVKKFTTSNVPTKEIWDAQQKLEEELLDLLVGKEHSLDQLIIAMIALVDKTIAETQELSQEDKTKLYLTKINYTVIREILPRLTHISSVFQGLESKDNLMFLQREQELSRSDNQSTIGPGKVELLTLVELNSRIDWAAKKVMEEINKEVP